MFCCLNETVQLTRGTAGSAFYLHFIISTTGFGYIYLLAPWPRHQSKLIARTKLRTFSPTKMPLVAKVMEKVLQDV